MFVRARAFSPAHACTRVCDFAAGTNEAEGDGEAGGVGDVTKQLEQQALEDKEREEDGEEGNSSFHPHPHHHPLHPFVICSSERVCVCKCVKF